MTKRILTVVPQPDSTLRPVIGAPPKGMFAFKRKPGPSKTEPVDLLCGQCGNVLVEGAGDQIHGDPVFQCNECNSWNDSALVKPE